MLVRYYIIFLLLASIMSISATSYSDDTLLSKAEEDNFRRASSLTDENLKGVVVKALYSEDASYFKLKTKNDVIWIKIAGINKLIIGKRYEFYPPYSVEASVIDKKLNITFNNLYNSLDIVNSKYVDLRPYSFRGIVLGTSKTDMLNLLTSMKLNVESVSETSYIIKDYDLGVYRPDVYFDLDIHNKLYSYRFVIHNKSNTDQDEIMSQLNYITNVFREKYGKPNGCNNMNNLSKQLEAKNYCWWSFGDTSISSTIRNDKDAIITLGSIVSLSRGIQSYNARLTRLTLEATRDIRKVEKEDKQQKQLKKDTAIKGAGKF
jgi:hypothetical protein